MRKAIAIALAVACAALAGCATRSDTAYRLTAKIRVPVIPPQGLIYTHFRAPLDFGPTEFGAKKGTAVSHQIGLPPLPIPGLATGLDLFAWGDASLDSAAKNGGIASVEHTDYDLMVVLFIYRRFTTEAYGN